MKRWLNNLKKLKNILSVQNKNAKIIPLKNTSQPLQPPLPILLPPPIVRVNKSAAGECSDQGEVEFSKSKLTFVQIQDKRGDRTNVGNTSFFCTSVKDVLKPSPLLFDLHLGICTSKHFTRRGSNKPIKKVKKFKIKKIKKLHHINQFLD